MNSGEIKAGAFGGSPQRPEESVETIEVHHYIVARKTLGEQVVADFTKHLFAIRQSLAAEMPSAAKIEKPDTDKDAAVPVHPGAAAYLDGELKTFFDRYSDLLYWGLMAMSVFGSGFAGLLELQQGRRPRPQAPRAREAAGDRQVGPQRRIRSRRSTTCRRRSTPSRPT